MGGIDRHHRPNAGGQRHARCTHNLDRRTTATTGPWPRPVCVRVSQARANSFQVHDDVARHHRPRDDLHSEGRRDHHILWWTEVPGQYASRSTPDRPGLHKRAGIRGWPRGLEGGGALRRNASRAGASGMTPLTAGGSVCCAAPPGCSGLQRPGASTPPCPQSNSSSGR